MLLHRDHYLLNVIVRVISHFLFFSYASINDFSPTTISFFLSLDFPDEHDYSVIPHYVY